MKIDPLRCFEPRSTRYVARVKASFEAQALMKTLGARLAQIDPGTVTIAFTHSPTLTQQHGFIHGGVIGAVLDSACGYAGFSLMDDDSAILTVEYKVNFLAAASGQSFQAIGRVVKPGRTLTVCEGALYGVDDEATPRLIATAQSTLMAVRDAGLSG